MTFTQSILLGDVAIGVFLLVILAIAGGRWPMTQFTQSVLLGDVAIGVFLLAILAIAIGDFPSFVRLSAVTIAFSVESMARMPEPMP